ncbi:MAG: hypothetical protein RLZZ67_380 [Candidatus Parcubacteria bacterium]
MSQPGRESAPINLFSLLSTVVFIVVLALSGGAFFYKQYVVKQIDVNKTTFDRAKNAFEPDTVKKITRLDTRLEVGKKLLASHIAVTPFFDFLSSVTLKTVRFKDFSFAYLAKDKIQVSMKGQAQNYAAVALQSDLFDDQKQLKNTIVSGMALEAAGTVVFSVSTTLDPALLSYASAIGVVVPEVKKTTGTSTAPTTPRQ